MSEKYRGLDNRNLRLLNISDAELVFQRHRKFIWVVQKAKNLLEAAKKLKLTRRQIINKSNMLRSKGVPLKTFHRNFTKMPDEQVQSLSLLATQLLTPAFDYEKFVRLWQTKGPDSIQAEFNLPRHKASWIACWLRTRCNINLKLWQPRLDKKKLQRIADETATASGSNIPPHKPPRPPK